MNYANLEKEIFSYKDFSKKVEQTLSKFALFFKNFSANGILFLEKSKKSLEEFYQELFKENHTTSHNISFSNFYQDFKSYLDKCKEILISIEKNISEKISEYILEHQNVNEETTNKLYSILVKLNENKTKLEKFKHNYFDACKDLMEQEKKLKGKKTKYKEIMSKYENISENQKQIYKDELSKFNKILDENEEQYQTIINNYHREYKNKLKFYIEIMKKFHEHGKNYSDIHKDILMKIERFTQYVNIKRDMEYFLQDMNYINENKRRFLNEQFLDYEIFKKNLEKNKDLNNNMNENSINFNNSNMTYQISYEKSIKILELGKFVDDEIEFEIEGEENKKIDGYIKDLIESEETLSKEKYVFLLQYVDNNNSNISNFMDLLINHYKCKKFVTIKNLENLQKLSNIICLIVSCSFNNKEIFDVSFLVMFVAEKTIYFDKGNIFNKYYLCKILPQRTVFSSIRFWEELINAHIDMMAKILTKKEIEKREKIKETNKNSGMFKKVKNIFGSKKDIENQRIENEILYGQIYDEKLPNYCVKVLEIYLKHFSNFNLEHKKASELIVNMSVKYKFDYSYVTYFMAELNSNICVNINKTSNNFESSESDNNKKKDDEKIDYNQLYISRLDKKISKHITDPTMRILIHSLKYLNFDEIPNILAINKLYNKTLSKLIYKNLLIKLAKELDISKHILIWKILLNYTETTIKYNYDEIKESVASNPEKVKSKDIIELDIVRTTFETDNDLNQIKIGSILKAIAYTLPKLNYCQGMNYIAAFLLNITNNEEESFYLFLSLLISTEYGKLFEKDLEKLKKYFYVFDRLICILLPELHHHFQENNVNVSYFISPWLITLFTNIFYIIKDRNNPLILLRIFDLFIFSGWKSIIKIGISLLKNSELKLMNLSSEELLSYLIGGICKNVFFQNENYDELMKILINFKIESYLISNVENEYELRESIPKVGGKDIFQNENLILS